MEDLKSRVRDLVVNEDLSAVVLISQRLGVDEDSVRGAVREMIAEGVLSGYLTPDGSRFFRSDLRVSSAPALPHENQEPAFLRYNSRPGKAVAAIGFCIVLAGYLLLWLGSGNMTLQNYGLGLMLLGIVVAICGCYQVGSRKTPI